METFVKWTILSVVSTGTLRGLPNCDGLSYESLNFDVVEDDDRPMDGLFNPDSGP